jgi:hypothetical protein
MYIKESYDTNFSIISLFKIVLKAPIMDYVSIVTVTPLGRMELLRTLEALFREPLED